MTDSPKIPLRPQIHGHRGCRGIFPENTLPAFLHALTLGVDVLEMDVVISADQQVVVAHEPWLAARLGLAPSGQPIDSRYERDYNIYQLPYAAVRQSAVGVVLQPQFPDQQLVATYRPLLLEVLLATEEACQRLGRPRVNYSIEIKSTPATDGTFHPYPRAFTELVLAAIPSIVLPRVTLLCFDERILQVARQLLPTLRVCLLIEATFRVSSLFKTLGFIPEVFGPDFQLLTLELVQKIKLLYPTLAITPWTINYPNDLIKAISWHLSGITTDYPEQAISVLLNT